MTDLVPLADPLDRAVDAALRLAAERSWDQITLRDIAGAADIPFADLYARAPGKAALVGRLSARLDRAALSAAESDTATDADPHDRLFEAVMARLEAMAPHRTALGAGDGDQGRAALLPRLPLTARALLEVSGIDTGGARGAARIAAMTAVWARTLQVWRDDEGALNRTMAEIDKRLRQMQARLKRVGAGF